MILFFASFSKISSSLKMVRFFSREIDKLCDVVNKTLHFDDFFYSFVHPSSSLSPWLPWLGNFRISSADNLNQATTKVLMSGTYYLHDKMLKLHSFGGLSNPWFMFGIIVAFRLWFKPSKALTWLDTGKIIVMSTSKGIALKGIA